MWDDSLACVGALILDRQGRIFVQRRSPRCRLSPNRWDIVGGEVPAGESVTDTLGREIHAQTGWRLAAVLRPVGEVAYCDENGRVRVEQDFLVRVKGDLARPVLDDARHSEFRWLTDADLEIFDDSYSHGDLLARHTVEAGFAAARRRLGRRPRRARQPA